MATSQPNGDGTAVAATITRRERDLLHDAILERMEATR